MDFSTTDLPNPKKNPAVEELQRDILAASVVAVLEAFPHHQLADDVGHGVGEEACWVKGFAWRSEDHCLDTRPEGFVLPFWLLISSCRCWASSQILCSRIFLPKPKFRRVDNAKRLCLFHASPLLW